MMTIEDAHFIVRCNKTIEFVAVERVLKDNDYRETGESLSDPNAILVSDNAWTRADINFDRVTIISENNRVVPAGRFLLTPLQKIKRDANRVAIFYDEDLKIEVLGHRCEHPGHVQIGQHVITPETVDKMHSGSQKARKREERKQ